MKRKNVAILFGGCSTEYKVSLLSAYSVIKHINTELYNIILIGITKDGNWFHYDGPIENIKDDTWYNEKYCIKAILSPNRSDHGIIQFAKNSINIIYIDAVLPILHGKNGEDGTLQGLIELSGIRLIGCDTMSSALCMDKDFAHTIVKTLGVKTPPSVIIKKNNCLQDKIKEIQKLNYPLFVKPVKSGSSIGINKVYNEHSLLTAIKNAFSYDNKVIVEEMIEGIEVGCAILGNNNVIIGEVDEIEVLTNFLNYNSKYVDTTSIIHIPARIDTHTKTRIKETALRIYDVLDCKDFARVDMFLTPNGDIYFNEVNTIPGFTCHSRYPSMLQATGLSFTEILDKMVD